MPALLLHCAHASLLASKACTASHSRALDEPSTADSKACKLEQHAAGTHHALPLWSLLRHAARMEGHGPRVWVHVCSQRLQPRPSKVSDIC